MNGILQTDELDDDMEFSIEGQSAVESYASGRKRLFLDEEVKKIRIKGCCNKLSKP